MGHQARWLLVADAFAGDVEGCSPAARASSTAWQRNGRQPSAGLAPAAAAVAMVHGLRGDEPARAEWLAIVDELGVPARAQGRLRRDVRRHGPAPPGDGEGRWSGSRRSREQVWKWVTWIWLHWYVALRAEAAVLAATRARDRVAAARARVAGNPVASAKVERAEALLDGDRPRLLATADAFDAAGCRYQAADPGTRRRRGCRPRRR